MSLHNNEVSERLRAQGSSQQTGPDPHADVNGQFPRPEYVNSTNFNKAALGAARNTLYTGGGVEGVDLLDTNVVPSQYPLNQVQQTITGHSIEMDDTPNNERVLIKHADGAGIELKPDGSVYIVSRSRTVMISGTDQHIIVDGEADMVYKGNVNVSVKGDYNVDVKGDYNVKVGGNRTESILGSNRKNVGGADSIAVRRGMSQTVTGQVTNTYLKGLSTNVKGKFSNNVDGDASFVSSGKTKHSASTGFLISADDATVSANTMKIVAGSGSIGGEAVTFGGQGAMFTEGVTAPTFHGDLDGTAITATVAQSQNYADPSDGGGVGSAGSITDTATPTIVIPATDTTATNLESDPTVGVNRVLIDEGDFIRNYIDRTTSYGGVSATPVDVNVARSRLRDPSNQANTTFVNTLLSESVLSDQYLMPAPPGIGRVVSASSEAVVGSDAIGNLFSEPFVVSQSLNVTLTPEPRYNPKRNSPITSSTRLSANTTVAKFLGSDDPTTLNFLRSESERVKVATYWMLHTQFLESIADNESEFKDFRIEVAEGLYRPGPSETVTPGSVNDLKMKGRAVVYKLIDAQGRINTSKTFDLAAYWKNTTYYDNIMLSYDMLDGVLNARVIVTLPEVDSEFNAVYSRTLSTEFNNTLLSNTELLEVLPFNSNRNDSVPNINNISLDATGVTHGINIGSSDKGPANITAGPGVHPATVPSAYPTMQALLQGPYSQMQSFYGGPLTINDALPHTTTDRRSRPGPVNTGVAQHWWGTALDISVRGMTDDQKQRLVAAACRAGFKGFGFGVGILHVDTGTPRQWVYNGLTTFGGKRVFGANSWVTYLNANRR